MPEQTIQADRWKWDIAVTVEKWRSEAEHRMGVAPYEIVRDEGNLLLNAGIDKLLDFLFGGASNASPNALDSTHMRIGVGDTNTAASASQTDLQAATGASTRQWKLPSSGPTRAAETETIVATFGSSEGNFHWQEWGMDHGTADGTGASVAPMINRKVTDFGTKVSGAVWVLTVTLTIS